MTDTAVHAEYCDKIHRSGNYLCSEEKEWREKTVQEHQNNLVQDTAEKIENSYYAIDDVALEEFKKIIEVVYPQDIHRKNRGLWAEEIKKMTHPQLGFAMLDGKEYSDLIYKLIKSKGSTHYKMSSKKLIQEDGITNTKF